jgi:hypothetical protein
MHQGNPEVSLMSKLRKLLLAAAFAVSVTPANACMKDTGTIESAEGKLAIGRAKDAAGRTERPYILTLAAPACLTASEPDDSVKGTTTIHVFAGTPKLQAEVARLGGKNVLVRGEVFAAHTAHHHAPIVMQINEISVR